jgi:methenyltetrahydromethanopterin cyclohydrolase
VTIADGAWPSVNALTVPLVDTLVARARELRIGVDKLPSGATIVDAGINHPGSMEAGRLIAEICMGGLGKVSLRSASATWPVRVNTLATHPVLACLGSQYAGWSLSHGEGKSAFRALGSGPARALAVKEQLFAELGYRDQGEATCLVLEVDKYPPQAIVDKIVHDCNVAAEKLTFILTPTKSLAGMVQIVARVLEVALHKVHALGFPLAHIIDGAGSAPLPPPAPDFLTSMGRSNDAILFGGYVQLFVECEDAAASDLAQKLPSSASRDYGKLFAQTFKEYQFDFYKIDPMLFAPAQVIVSNLNSGNSFRAGALDEALIDASFSATAKS